MTYNLNQHVFTPFLLMEAGIVLLIVSGIGFWTSSTRSRTIMSIYIFITLPLCVTLLGLGGKNYSSIGGVRRRYTTQDIPAGATLDEVTTLSWNNLLPEAYCLLNTLCMDVTITFDR